MLTFGLSAFFRFKKLPVFRTLPSSRELRENCDMIHYVTFGRLSVLGTCMKYNNAKSRCFVHSFLPMIHKDGAMASLTLSYAHISYLLVARSRFVIFCNAVEVTLTMHWQQEAVLVTQTVHA